MHKLEKISLSKENTHSKVPEQHFVDFNQFYKFEQFVNCCKECKQNCLMEKLLDQGKLQLTDYMLVCKYSIPSSYSMIINLYQRHCIIKFQKNIAKSCNE